MRTCFHDGCHNLAESGKDECFKHRVSGVGFTFSGSAIAGRGGWNRTAAEWRQEHFGTTSEKELAARGIERADKV